MASVRITINRAAFNAVRNSPAVVSLLEQEGARILAAANGQVTTHDDDGEPFRMHTVHNASRAVTFVGTANYDGIIAEATNRALTRAVGVR